MKYLLTLAAIAAMTACQGRAENVAAATELEMNDVKTVETAQSDTGIPVGVRELPAGISYNLDQKPGHLVVIDFNADWCGPCRQFAPIFQAAAKKYAGEVEFLSVDVETHQAMCQQLGIQSIPYILFIQPDGTFNSWVGFLPEKEFLKAIDQLK